jgi:carbamoyl-phosphate synthase large subunit
MKKIGLEVPKNAVVKSLDEARKAMEYVGLPAIIRPSFTMGGAGGGIAYNREEFEQIITSGLDASPIGEVLIDESVLGWKEFEMEVVRDKADNCIIICSIENLDPMGVHTGDSITVAPALTLTDKEYQNMRNASFAVLREIGVDTGGSNVQFAVNPVDGRMIVIEMNPRVSRSSALASKATGFPIAKVAAKLAVGYTLDEILNDVTKVTPASFEPTIDYVVVKIPRFTFEKFPGSEPILTTAMKSVGESMAMGRNFKEALQKALRSLETGDVRKARHKHNVRPVFKRVDTCAAEFESPTPYMYSCYEGHGDNAFCEAQPSDRKKVVILGGGPNRIGQGIEFDYCCVHAAYALKDAGYETIMINCNPETVSTDYDTSDRLYFEPLTAEDVIEIIEVEKKNGTLHGVILQFGGQTPLKLSHALEEAGIPIIGTTVDSIDLAEDRERFQKLLFKLKLKQPKNAICKNADEVISAAEEIGFPVVVRPSYVLGGRAMRIIHSGPELKNYVQELLVLFGDGPILLDGYLQDAIELDVDCLSDGKEFFVPGIMEHIEEAGIHSGDSACSLPPYSLPDPIINEVRKQTIALADALKVKGLMNVQFAVKDGDIYIIEVNPRASRTVPFVAKATGIPIAKIASRLMAGESLASFDLPDDATLMKNLKHVAVKEVVFPFARFPGVDTILGPEMKSTGETMGLDKTFAAAFAKGFIGSGSTLPREGSVFLSVRDGDKPAASVIAQELLSLGFRVVCTRGTGEYLQMQGLPVEIVNKVREGRPHIVDMMKDGKIAMVFNTTEGQASIADSYSIRRTSLLGKIPYSTTIAGARAMVQAIASIAKAGSKGLDVAPLQSYITSTKLKKVA